jgi:hypothetical protein
MLITKGKLGFNLNFKIQLELHFEVHLDSLAWNACNAPLPGRAQGTPFFWLSYPLPQNFHRAMRSFKSAQQPQRDGQQLTRTYSWLNCRRKELTSLNFQGFEPRDYARRLSRLKSVVSHPNRSGFHCQC